MVNLQVGILSRYWMPHHLRAFQDKLPEILDFFLPTDKLRYLYHVLIEPIEKHIHNLSLLYIIPHASLQDLPFQALRKEDENYLIDDVAIAYAPSLAVLRHCRDHARSNYQTCFAAGVSEEQGGPKLASDEAVSVANIFHTQPFPATRDVVRQQAGQFDVIHLSCHGDSHSAITSFQGFKLADGTLYQNEIAGIDCRSSLVFLSACNTADGDLIPGQDMPMTGLIGAFIRAGSPSVIASLWEVDIKSARSMASAFYNALKNNPANKAEALRQSQIELKSQKKHPFFWASFSLWGSY
ncbi:MAG: CHAT domain-containing protein [Cyanobacteria bacterium LVE1205-1]|jgi:CHAT domain-containing protein